MVGPSHHQRSRAHQFLKVVFIVGWLAFVGLPQEAKANSVPSVLSFSIVDLGGGYWLLYGSIDDDDPETCRIDFSGDLAGQYCVADYYGNYQLVVELPIGVGGWISATAIDSSNATSDPLFQYLPNY